MGATKNRRTSYNYRDKYMKHNNGIFFGGYICSICHKKITKEEMEVDHIIPLSKYGVNHVCNCVATCHDCNAKKGDRMSTDILKQLLWKILEEIIIFFSFIVHSLLSLGKTHIGNIMGKTLFTIDLKLMKLDINLTKLAIIFILILIVGGKIC